MKKAIIAIIIIVVVGAAYYLLKDKNEDKTNNSPILNVFGHSTLKSRLSTFSGLVLVIKK